MLNRISLTAFVFLPFTGLLVGLAYGQVGVNTTSPRAQLDVYGIEGSSVPAGFQEWHDVRFQNLNTALSAGVSKYELLGVDPDGYVLKVPKSASGAGLTTFSVQSINNDTLEFRDPDGGVIDSVLLPNVGTASAVTGLNFDAALNRLRLSQSGGISPIDVIIDATGSDNADLTLRLNNAGDQIELDDAGTVRGSILVSSFLSKMSADSVPGAAIKNNSVTAGQLAPDSVGSSELSDGSVTSAKILDGSIAKKDIDAAFLSSIENTEIERFDGSLNNANILRLDLYEGQNATVSQSATIDLSSLAGSLGGNSSHLRFEFDGGSGVLQLKDIGVTPNVVRGSVPLLSLVGSVPANSLAGTALKDDSVTAGQLAPDSVGSSELSDDSVTSAKILDGSIAKKDVDAGFLSSIENTEIERFDGSLNNSNVLRLDLYEGQTATVSKSATIDLSSLSGSLGGNSSHLRFELDGGSGVLQLKDIGVTPNVVRGSVPLSTLMGSVPANSLAGTALKDDSVTAGQLAPDSVGSSELSDDSVTSAKILDGSIAKKDVDAGFLTSIENTEIERFDGSLNNSNVLRLDLYEGQNATVSQSATIDLSSLSGSLGGNSSHLRFELDGGSGVLQLKDIGVTPNVVRGSVLLSTLMGSVPANSLAGTALKDDSVTAGQLAPDSVGSSELSDDSVTSAKILDGSIVKEDIDAAFLSSIENTETERFDGSLNNANVLRLDLYEGQNATVSQSATIDLSSLAAKGGAWNVAKTTTPSTKNTDDIYISGKVGVGTNDPKVALDVSGASVITGVFDAAKGQVVGTSLEVQGAFVVDGQESDQAQALLVDGKAKFTGVATAPSFNAVSDRRLKEDIRPFEGGIDILRQMETYRYRYKSDVDKVEYYGVIAQELESIDPNVIGRFIDEEDGQEYLSVRTNSVLYVMLDALKYVDAELSLTRSEMAEERSKRDALLADVLSRLERLEALID